MEKTAIVTGGSSGIGRAAADALSRRGFRVYELSRHGADRDGITHIRADVTDDDSVRRAVEQVVSETHRIDALVTCAGMGVSGPVEFISEEDVKRQFDVNLFGTMRCVKAVLPYMRKRCSGHILCVSSVAAVYPIPFQAHYSASKAAINAYADALRTEVAPFGVRVTAIMPGDIATGFTDARRKTRAGDDVYRSADSAVGKMENDERNGMDPAVVGEFIAKLAEKANPAPLYTVGGQYKALVFLKRLFPVRCASAIVGKMYQ